MSYMVQIAAMTLAATVSGVLASARNAHAQTSLLEVERSDSTKLLQVHDDAGLVVRGVLDAGSIPATGAGVRFMWYPRKAALRAGSVQSDEWDDGNVGVYSVAFGVNSIANAGQSIAMGGQSRATGVASIAMGYQTAANGSASTALGLQTTAAGTGSVALGSAVTAQGSGSFAFGDRNTDFPVIADPNTFAVRAFGGIALNTGVNIGCDLPSGTGAWACTSSRLAKEGFEEVDGDSVLARLATIPIQRWHYLGTRSAHVGPTAEDFHAAFGLGEGSRTISLVDADGIALLAAQALARRTAVLEDNDAVLRNRLARSQAHIAGLRAQLAILRERVDRLAEGPTADPDGGR